MVKDIHANPLGLKLNSLLQVKNDPFTTGLNFRVTGIDRYDVPHAGGNFSLTDYGIEAPCWDPGNEYAYDGTVSLWIRHLPAEGPGQTPTAILLWGEDADAAGPDLIAQFGDKAPSNIEATFGDGTHTYQRVDPVSAPYFAHTNSETAGGRDNNGLRYWVYSRKAEAAAGAPAYTQFLLVEQVMEGPAEGNIYIRRGYEMDLQDIINDGLRQKGHCP